MIEDELQYFHVFINKNPPILCIEKINCKTASYLLLFHDFYKKFQKVQQLIGITAIFKEVCIDLKQDFFDREDSVFELLKRKKAVLNQATHNRKDYQETVNYFEEILKHQISY